MQVQRIHEALMCSVDEVAAKVRTDGKKVPKEELWFIINKDANTSVQAAYAPEGRAAGSSRKGYEPYTTVRLNVIMCAGGYIGLPFMLVTGVTPEEMDLTLHPSGVVVMKVENMGRGVSNVTGSANHGFICFVVGSGVAASDDGLTPMARAHLYFLEHIVIPFLAGIRRELGWNTGTAITPELRAVLLNDGAFDQMGAYTCPTALELFVKQHITNVKLAASCTTTTQAADMSGVFPSTHYQAKNIKPKECFSTALQTDLIAAALKGVNGLRLAAPKVVALSTFGAAVSSILGKAGSETNVMKGFVAGGYVHPDDHKAACLEAIRNTCQVPRTPESLKVVEENWSKFYHEMVDKGVLSDATMAAAGVEEDMAGTDGKVRSRDTKVESHRRVQITSSEALKTEREEILRKLQDLRELAVEVEAAKVKQKLDASANAEAAILAAVERRRGGPPGGRRNVQTILAHATIDDVLAAKVGVDGLKALLHARMYTDNKATMKWPAKGTKLSATSGASTLLSMFLQMKGKAVILAAPTPAQVATVAAPLQPVTVNSGGGGDGSGGGGSNPLASQWLQKPGWVKLMLSSTTGAVPGASVTAHSGPLADQLAERLLEELSEHKAARVPPAMQDHWVWDFAISNIPPVAAFLAMSGLTKSNVGKVKSGASLLRTSNMMRVKGLLGELHGAYGHLHEEDMRRSGKVVRFTGGGGFNKRNPEHKKCAELLTDADRNSGFYPSFPTRTSKHVVEGLQLGWWDELEQVVLLGFDLKNKTATRALTNPSPTQSLLNWSAADLVLIDEVNFRGATKIEEKQLHMVGYLFELAFDLMIARDDNVSKSAGFETPLGLFKNGE